MLEIERFLEDKLKPIHETYYALWVYWWPLWRSLFSGRSIMQLWEQNNLVREGQTFLDYGCGTGAFTFPAAKLVGQKGKVYALDCFRRQLKMVEERSIKERLNNIETILSDSKTGLPDESIDVIWMCDVFHELRDRREILEDLYRVLKAKGVLVIYDGMRAKVLDYSQGLFSLTQQEDKFLKFTKTKQGEPVGSDTA